MFNDIPQKRQDSALDQAAWLRVSALLLSTAPALAFALGMTSLRRTSDGRQRC